MATATGHNLPALPPHAPHPRRSRRPRRLVAVVLLCCAAAALSASGGLVAQAASTSTSPALPTAVFTLGVEPVGPELRQGGEDPDGHLRARAPQAAGPGGTEEEPTTRSTTARGTRLTSAAAAATTRIELAASADAGDSAAAPTIATVLSSMSGELGSLVSSSLAVAASTRSSDEGVTASATSTSTTPASISTSTAVPAGYDLPQAFDSTLGTNFTSTACPSFFATFLADPTFQSCAPFSLLLTTSTAFFQAQRSPRGLLPYVLNASCSALEADCSATMTQLARMIQLKSTCGRDLEMGNPLATEALQGFQSYTLMREAGCARSNETQQFCFADASAKKDPSDLYFYYLAEGTTLPSGTTPTCDYCTQNLLGIFSRYASNSPLAISRTYASGRSAAALTCGPDFAPALAVQSKVSAAALRGSPAPAAAAMAAVAAGVLLAVFGS